VTNYLTSISKPGGRWLSVVNYARALWVVCFASKIDAAAWFPSTGSLKDGNARGTEGIPSTVARVM